jgi:hypothetical protein
MSKRLPSDREQRAVERGADELMALAEFHFRKRPRVLLRLRKLYAWFCVHLYSTLERSYRRQTAAEK